MPNFVAEFTGRSLLAFCCCLLATGLSTQPLAAQDGAAGAADGAADGAAAAGNTDEDKPFEIGTAKNAAEYEVVQRRAIQQIDLNSGFLTGKILKDYRSQEREYRTVLRQGIDKRNPADGIALRAGLDYRALVLSDPDVQNDATLFGSYMKNLKRDIDNAASIASIPNAATRAENRQLICQIVFDHLEKLITTGNVKARSAALEQLLNLEVVPPKNRQRIRMYDSVHKLLVQVMQDRNQPDAIKLRAANVIKKYLQKTDSGPQIQMAFAEAIAAELNRQWLAVPYMNTMLSSLEWVSVPKKVVGDNSPVVFCAMVDVINNKELDLFVRCRATRVLGRVAFDRSVNFEPLAWATAELTMEVSLAYYNTKDPKDSKWARCGWFLYTAYHHEDGKETSGPAPSMPKGYLNRTPESKLVREAYKSAMPAIAQLMSEGNPKQMGRLTTPLLAFLKTDKPADMKCHSQCAAIAVAQ